MAATLFLSTIPLVNAAPEPTPPNPPPARTPTDPANPPPPPPGAAKPSPGPGIHPPKPDGEHKHESKVAELLANIQPLSNSNVRGTALFEQAGGDAVKVTVKVGGLEANSKHAIHIHEFGNLSNADGTSAGGHYNPDGHPHGLPDAETGKRHPGDFGNLEADGSGNATLVLTVEGLSLAHGKNAIIGRAVIIHAKPDDGGQPTGNAGDRIGGGIIGVSKAKAPPAK